MFLIAAYLLMAVSGLGEFRGAALRDTTLYTWGEQLTSWSVPKLKAKVLATGDFGEGGCLTDLDNDGVPEFAGYERSAGSGRLTWRRSPGWMPETVDTRSKCTTVVKRRCLDGTAF